jgi:hypothetical protein
MKISEQLEVINVCRVELEKLERIAPAFSLASSSLEIIEKELNNLKRIIKGND